MHRDRVAKHISQLQKSLTWRLAAVTICCLTSHVNAQQWRVDANNRIEQHRKSDLTIRVTDEYGNQVDNAAVDVQMKRHHFRFGTAVTAGWINNNSQTGQTYRTKLLENFNEVVFENDLKWPAWIGLWGNGFNWNNTRQAIDWLDANDLPARGHYLSWATWSGADAWGNSQNNSTLPQRLFNHISDIAGTVGDRVYEWDVINHPVGWTGDTYENRFGSDFFGDIIDHARTQVPAGTPLWINEDDVIAGQSRANDYERIIEKLINDGSAPDGIGFQAHFIEQWARVSNSTPQQVYSRIERFADLIPRLRVTEFDIDVGNHEALQGELLRDYLTVMFSHENIEAVTMWGFWGGAHWRGENGALFRNDWSEKPSLAAYRDLVFNQWWTDESGATDLAGDYDVRAFDGFYDVTVNHGGQEQLIADFLLTSDSVLDVVVAPLLEGDFNADGAVDAADYTVWRDNEQGLFETSHYETWRQNFGATLAAVVANGVGGASVPEPGSLLLITFVAMFAVGRSVHGSCCMPAFVNRT